MSTFSDEDRAAVREVKDAVEDRLLTLPGVVGVDIAEKVSDGEPTGDLAIIVWVEEKLPPDELEEDELVPREVDGVPTDVQEMRVELQ